MSLWNFTANVEAMLVATTVLETNNKDNTEIGIALRLHYRASDVTVELHGKC
jgi:hypothetical protein